jgi:hypothetical protein
MKRSKSRRPADGKHQTTIDSCASVVKLSGFSSLVFSSDDLATLRATLEAPDAPLAAKLEALRVLSSLVIGVADLQSTMIGRTVNKLASSSADSDVKRLAANLVSKWREEVRRAQSKAIIPDSHAASGSAARAPPTAVAQASRDGVCARFAQCLGGGSTAVVVAAQLEAAIGRTTSPTYGEAVCRCSKALVANASLRAALMSGWLAPSQVLALDEEALCRRVFF